MLAPATALGIYEGGLVPVDAGDRALPHPGRPDRRRDGRRSSSRSSSRERPRRRHAAERGPSPRRRLGAQAGDARRGRRSASDRALEVTDLERAGVEIAASSTCGTPPRHRRARAPRQACAPSRSTDGRIECDLLVVSGGRQPAYSLLAQAGARVEYDAARAASSSRPTLPPGVEAVGSVGRRARRAAVPAAGSSRAAATVLRLHLRGRDRRRTSSARSPRASTRSSSRKRYTTVTMGPVPGQALPRSRRSACSRARPGSTRRRSARRPRGRRGRRSSSGLLAGRHHEPMKRTPLHFRHEQAGATMMWTGAWRRPHSYGDPAAEVRAVHEGLGVIDVSTLGKLLVEGPDAGAVPRPPLPEPLRRPRSRAGSATACSRPTAAGSWTTARSPGSATSSSTSRRPRPAPTRVCEWFEWWNAVWGYDVEIVNVTGALAAVNLAGPQARDALGALTDADVSNEAFALPRREGDLGSRACRASRSESASSASSATSSTAPRPPASTSGTRSSAGGARPFGLEPQRVLRLEKAHVIVGQDTDSESNLLSPGCRGSSSWTRTTSSASGRSSTCRRRACASASSASRCRPDVLPQEGAQVVVDGALGRPRHERRRERAARQGDRPRLGRARAAPRTGATIAIGIDGALHTARASHSLRSTTPRETLLRS